MVNILLTGGAGYIGRHLYVCHLEAGFKPTIYDNRSKSQTEVLDILEKIVGTKPITVKGDINDVELLSKV